MSYRRRRFHCPFVICRPICQPRFHRHSFCPSFYGFTEGVILGLFLGCF